MALAGLYGRTAEGIRQAHLQQQQQVQQGSQLLLPTLQGPDSRQQPHASGAGAAASLAVAAGHDAGQVGYELKRPSAMISAFAQHHQQQQQQHPVMVVPRARAKKGSSTAAAARAAPVAALDPQPGAPLE
jgi:hypothetical protein